MGSYLNQKLFSNFYYNVFVFDLEYVGKDTNLSNCYIWDIGVVHLNTGQKFSITIDPGIRPIPKAFSPEFIDLTENILMSRKATTFKLAWKSFLYFIDQLRVQNYPLLFISHNCFKGDKIMLEHELKRNNLKFPYDWFFFDSLIFCRFALPKLSSYALSDLYEFKSGCHMKNAHYALPDAEHLCQLLNLIGLQLIEGPIYPFNCTSLQVVKWLGPSCEKLFFSNQILCLEDLRQFLISSYSLHCLNGIQYNLKDYIIYKITEFGIKQGNSISITNSLLERWL